MRSKGVESAATPGRGLIKHAIRRQNLRRGIKHSLTIIRYTTFGPRTLNQPTRVPFDIPIIVMCDPPS